MAEVNYEQFSCFSCKARKKVTLKMFRADIYSLEVKNG